MKHNDETEIDLLLRRHARSEGAAARIFNDGGSAKDDALSRAGGGVHLDADELNAFAEGALPAPARARYAAHLSDCDACREVVTGLILMNSAANEKERVALAAEPSAKSSWREWIGALFAPPVLRFAVPVFGLLIVGFILLAVLRTRQDQPTLVAQNNEKQIAQSNANISSAPEEQRAADTSTAAQSNTNGRESILQDQKKIAPSEQNGAAASSTENAPSQSNVKSLEQTRTETAPDAAPSVDKMNAGKRDEDRREEDVQRSETLRERGRARDEERAAASIPPPAPSAAAGAVAVKEKPEVAKEPPKDQPTRQSNNATLDGAAANNNEVATAQNKGYGGAPNSPNASLSARRKAARPSTVTESKSGEDNARDDASETRRVGGRTFRRQGGAWVDTAYNSSHATVTVRRGTEQYRALVADEPAIGSISNQLGGEVIIVWKNRAYRIDSGAAQSEKSERKRNE
ncbi:MAG: zf-HC2 domain-containing protein [Pyrinomonadaceae bacterium]